MVLLTKSVLGQFYSFTILASGISKEVEHWSYQLEVEGLSPASLALRERIAKMVFLTKSVLGQFYSFTILACGISKEVNH
jgi:hypothetical protein